MDIDLLAKMVKEVIMDHDAVTLPGLGSFVAELVPSSFADKGYTIHPPYRRLYFSPKQGTDSLLVGLYARSNQISEEDATRILVEFLSEMKEVLKLKKTIVFPSLGRLRATRENHFFFVADEDLDIYPAGFGLGPISLKTHEETKEEVEEAVQSLAQMLETPSPVISSEQAVAPEGQADAPAEMSAAPEGQADAPAEVASAPVEATDIEAEEDPEDLVVLAEDDSTADPEPAEPVNVPAAESEPAEPVNVPAVESEPAESEPATEVATEPAPEVAAEPATEVAAVAPDEVAAEPVTGVVAEPERQEAAQTAAAETSQQVVQDVPSETPRGRSFWRGLGWTLLVLAGVLVLAVIALAVVGRVAPEWLDSFLYSPAEFDILHN